VATRPLRPVPSETRKLPEIIRFTLTLTLLSPICDKGKLQFPARQYSSTRAPITLKLPPTTVRLLRAYAKDHGLTIGTTVTRALDAFLGAPKRHS
jgi:hypothetical protein